MLQRKQKRRSDFSYVYCFSGGIFKGSVSMQKRQLLYCELKGAARIPIRYIFFRPAELEEAARAIHIRLHVQLQLAIITLQLRVFMTSLDYIQQQQCDVTFSYIRESLVPPTPSGVVLISCYFSYLR